MSIEEVEGWLSTFVAAFWQKRRFDQSYAYGEKEDEFKLLCKHVRHLND